MFVGQAYRTAAEAVYRWYSSWVHRRIFAGFLWKMGWNCWLRRYERTNDWKVCSLLAVQQGKTLLLESSYVLGKMKTYGSAYNSTDGLELAGSVIFLSTLAVFDWYILMGTCCICHKHNTLLNCYL